MPLVTVQLLVGGTSLELRGVIDTGSACVALSRDVLDHLDAEFIRSEGESGTAWLAMLANLVDTDEPVALVAEILLIHGIDEPVDSDEGSNVVFREVPIQILATRTPEVQIFLGQRQFLDQCQFSQQTDDVFELRQVPGLRFVSSGS